MQWVFAYGSNMHLGDLRRWFGERGLPEGTIAEVVEAVLPDHRLVWNYFSPARRGGAANVEPAAASEVPGLALLMDATALDGLDKKEGHPGRYYRRRHPLGLDRGWRGEREQTTAWVYSVQPAYRQPEPVLPRLEYLALMVQAARQYGFPRWYLEALERTDTAE